MFRRLLGLTTLILLALQARAAGPWGADNGWTVDHSSGSILLTSTVANQMAKGQTGWIRIEMYLVNGHSTWDSTVLGYYDSAVNNARNAGIQVLMLIDGGSWPGGQSAWCSNNWELNTNFNGDNPYVGAFATNAVVPIVQHFHDRVKFFEIWNEPNSWTAKPTNVVCSCNNGIGTNYSGGSFIYPSNYGWLLARSWEAAHITHALNDVTLFFGGVFGHDPADYSSAGAQYVDDTYSTGTNRSKGASFYYTKTNDDMAFPLDGIGQHLYIYQGGTVNTNTFRQYEDWVHQACTKYEGTSTAKKTFITEFGWQTTNSVNTTDGVGQAVQETNLIYSFSTIQATPYVQMAIWFQWSDNVAGKMYYGVTNSSTGPKLSYPDYQFWQRFEGMNTNRTTNASIQAYFNSLGPAVLGSPFDHGHSPYVYNFLNGYAQDCQLGAHSNLTLISYATNGTNVTYEINDMHGIWSHYNTNGSGATFGYPLTNDYAYSGGRRQDFSRGYMTWDSTNQIIWFPGNMAPVTGLSAVAANAQVSLQWNSNANSTSFNVKRSTNSTGPFSTLTSIVGGTSYADAPVNNGTTYYYVVSGVNALGESSNSLPAHATPASPPIITAQPLSLTVNEGDDAQFSVSASSLVQVSYNWQFNGTNLVGATNNPFNLGAATPELAGPYSVVVSNYGGSTTSSNAILSVRPLLTLTPDGVLTWSGTFTLQSTTNLDTPFADVAGATSPYTNNDTGSELQEFFRLHN
jgi:hypothetical protein